MNIYNSILYTCTLVMIISSAMFVLNETQTSTNLEEFMQDSADFMVVQDKCYRGWLSHRDDKAFNRCMREGLEPLGVDDLDVWYPDD